VRSGHQYRVLLCLAGMVGVIVGGCNERGSNAVQVVHCGIDRA